MKKILCLHCARQEQVEEGVALPDCCQSIWLTTTNWTQEKLEKVINEIKDSNSNNAMLTLSKV